MSLKAQNLDELRRRFDTEALAADALEAVLADVNGNGEWDLAHLLRNHEYEEIDDFEEVSMRDSFDELLTFYSCLEIASIIKFIPTDLPPALRTNITTVLSHRSVRRYYRQYYPLLLPDMLLGRIAKINIRKEENADDAIPLFFEFLHINNTIENNENVEVFLWFLDDGYHDGHDWATTVKTLGKPKKLIEALTKPGGKNPTEQAVDGLRTFLTFCVAFDDLLHRAAPFPVFRDALWHYHAYWFRNMRGKVRSDIEDALKQFKAWLSSPAAKQLPEEDAALLMKESDFSLKQVHKVVRRLTGTTFGQTLTRTTREIRTDSKRAADALNANADGRKFSFKETSP